MSNDKLKNINNKETNQGFIRIYNADGTEEERIIKPQPKCPNCGGFLIFDIENINNLVCTQCKKKIKKEEVES